MKDFRQSLGKRVRQARQRLGFSQKSLAEQMGIQAHQIVSQIETGERDVKAWELSKLADILKVDISYLLAPGKAEITPVVLWRDLPDADKEITEADFLKKCREYYNLEQAASIQKYSNLPSVDVEKEDIDYNFVNDLAEKVSRELNLGRKPATALEKVLEDQYGIKIWYKDLGEKGSAASTIGPFGHAILMNSKQAPWRRNFNFAHELFHLITWKSIPIDVLIKDQDIFNKFEKYANAFASSLLLSAQSILNELNKHIQNNCISYFNFIEIARDFDVSSEALLYRLLNLGKVNKKTVEKLLNDEEFKNIDRSTMHEKWWDPPPLPKRFVLLGFKAYKKGNVSRARLAEYLESSLFDLKKFLLEYGFNEDEDYEAQIRVA